MFRREAKPDVVEKFKKVLASEKKFDIRGSDVD